MIRRLEVIILAGDIYNELYNIYRSKYNKEIDRLSAKNKKKLDYKQLKISGDYRYSSDEEQEEQEKQEEKQEKQKEKSEESKFFKYIVNKSKDINYFLFKYYFNFIYPSDLAKKPFEIKDEKKNNDFVEEIKNRWSKLTDRVEKTLGDKKEDKGLDKILEIVEDILNFNKQNQQGEGIKILTPNQMLSRLLIALAQLNAGNNSNKLKNEIRQLLYSLYRSKNMTEQIYKSLIGII